MATYSLTLRETLNRKLTIEEMDNNFLYLQNLAGQGILIGPSGSIPFIDANGFATFSADMYRLPDGQTTIRATQSGVNAAVGLVNDFIPYPFSGASRWLDGAVAFSGTVDLSSLNQGTFSAISYSETNNGIALLILDGDSGVNYLYSNIGSSIRSKLNLSLDGLSLQYKSLSGNKSNIDIYGTSIQYNVNGGTSFTLPSIDGNNGDTLITNGSGVLSFTSSTGSGPGGSSNYIQYNISGSFSGDSNFQWDSTNKTFAALGPNGSSLIMDDSNRIVKMEAIPFSGNRKGTVKASDSNSGIEYYVHDSSPLLERYVYTDGEGVKIGAYEVGGTNRSASMGCAEAASSISYGSDGIVTRAVISDSTGSYFTTLDIFPYTILLGINVADKKAVTNYGERHKVRTIAIDSDVILFDSDYTVVMRPINNSVSVYLPYAPKNGDTYIIKDGTGTAMSHSIFIYGFQDIVNPEDPEGPLLTVGKNIQGSTMSAIQVDWEKEKLVFNETLDIWLLL